MSEGSVIYARVALAEKRVLAAVWMAICAGAPKGWFKVAALLFAGYYLVDSLFISAAIRRTEGSV